jgi:hypothetical protein
MQLGDLLINDADGRPPLNLMKAMAVIAEWLHPTFDVYYEDGVSLDSCILVSAVVRDFLFRIGFKDAEVRSVSFFIERRKGEEVTHQLVIGKPGDPDANGKWNGHMVAFLPKTGWLIDCTLFQAQRRHWETLPGMVATPIHDYDMSVSGRKVITGFAAKQDADVIRGMWTDTSENNRWRTAPDLIRGGRRERHRRAVADRLVHYFQRSKEPTT